MSNLEDKLSASMNTSRTRASAAKSVPVEPTAKQVEATPRRRSVAKSDEDLNSGTGLALNPPRIWPD
ncbi:MAG: hypothetical protein K0041_02670 [Acidithiobacillus sp.]|nr:hypothetical protein [Acidithiobacillus sp.]